MNNKWQKGIKDLQKLSLSKKEKQILLDKIFNELPKKPVISTWVSPFVMFKSHVTAFVVFILLVAGSSISLAAESSLPGDILYPIKISVTEPVRGVIKISPEEKIEWEIEKAVRRIEEVSILVTEERLDEKKQEKAEELFEKHTENFKVRSEREIEKHKIEEEGKQDAVKENENDKGKAQIKEQENERNFERERKEVEDKVEELKKAKGKALERNKKEKESKNNPSYRSDNND